MHCQQQDFRSCVTCHAVSSSVRRRPRNAPQSHRHVPEQIVAAPQPAKVPSSHDQCMHIARSHPRGQRSLA
eukprot:2616994-Prymnesium_polylepis.1